ncbi:MAG: bifunctional precorrin-2 dehydrogenase/sirohydrochlorin ferrochelatase [Chloroflexi bacterium]|nr:bifunctional precorrin-2 dehydrogenase/sirohydrochlorin ferrochelatase [Chloroflexota bacterium]
MHCYPVCLNLQGRRGTVIGGGLVAEGKVGALLAAGAQVAVISPGLSNGLRQLTDQGRISHVARLYRPGDLAGSFLTISATDDRAVNEQVWQEANERGILINVVDAPSRCTFTMPAVVRRGDLTLAIATGGKAPALAVRLREQLQRLIGHEYGRFLELAGALRLPLARRHPDLEQRRALWYRLVDSDVLELLRRGDEPAARRRIAEITGLTLEDTEHVD